MVEVTRRIMTMVVTLFDEWWMGITRRISTQDEAAKPRPPVFWLREARTV